MQHAYRYWLIAVSFFFAVSALAQQTPGQQYMEHLFEEKIRWPQGMEFTPLAQPNLTKNTVDERKVTLSTNRSENEGEAFIAVNPTDSLNLVLSYMQLSQSGLNFPIYVTKDGGQTWRPRQIDINRIARLDTNLLTVGGGDPVFAFDANGKLYFSWLLAGLNFQNPSALIMRMFWGYSNDGGETWSNLRGRGRLVAQGGLDVGTGNATNFDVGAPDRQWMACDLTGGPYANSLYLASLFVANDSGPVRANGMVVRYKREQDSSFQQTFIQVGDTGLFVSQFANIAVDSEGFVHVSYGRIDQGRYVAIMHAISRDGGQSFSTPVQVATIADNNGTALLHDRENSAPSLATGPNPGEVYLAWSSWGNVAGIPIIQGYISSSQDYGQTWSAPQDLNLLDGSGQLQHALFPVVATNAAGALSLSWYAADLNAKANYLMVTSDDGGNTFSAPIVLSTDTTDFSNYGDQAFFGDYFNQVRVGCKTFAVWSDGRNNLGPKMYVGRVDHCGPVSGLEISPLDAGWQVGLPYPNPVQRQVSLDLEAEKAATWNISLVDMQGRKLGTLIQKALPAGSHTLSLELPELAAGSYWLHISDGAARATRGIVVE